MLPESPPSLLIENPSPPSPRRGRDPSEVAWSRALRPGPGSSTTTPALCVALCIQCTHVCLLCVWARVQSSTGDGAGQSHGPPLDPAPPSPPPPPYLSIQSADINTDLYSFSACEPLPARRRGTGGSGRAEPGSDCGRSATLICFCFSQHLHGEKKMKTKEGKAVWRASASADKF